MAGSPASELSTTLQAAQTASRESTPLRTVQAVWSLSWLTRQPPTSKVTHYLTLSEAVELGYAAYSTLRSWIAKGKLPAYKTGTRVKLLRSDLDALVIPTGIDPVDAAIDKLIAAAPPLTAEQTRHPRDLLGGAQ